MPVQRAGYILIQGVEPRATRLIDLADAVAGDEVTGGGFLEFRRLLGTAFAGIGAAGAEGAAGGGVQRAGDIPVQNDALVGPGDLGIRHRDGREQRLGIGVQRVLIDLRRVGQLHHLAQVHDRDAVADVPDDEKVVGDEEVRQPQALLELLKHIDDLGLDGDVQRGDGLVADDEVRIDRQGPGDADALALAAGKFVGVAGSVLAVEADIAHEL